MKIDVPFFTRIKNYIKYLLGYKRSIFEIRAERMCKMFKKNPFDIIDIKEQAKIFIDISKSPEFMNTIKEYRNTLLDSMLKINKKGELFSFLKLILDREKLIKYESNIQYEYFIEQTKDPSLQFTKFSVLIEKFVKENEEIIKKSQEYDELVKKINLDLYEDKDMNSVILRKQRAHALSYFEEEIYYYLYFVDEMIVKYSMLYFVLKRNLISYGLMHTTGFLGKNITIMKKKFVASEFNKKFRICSNDETIQVENLIDVLYILGLTDLEKYKVPFVGFNPFAKVDKTIHLI